ncbi:hypothetical protein GOBAR_AA01216 [Gossypium barbadense]|uniref:Uncharacterized protein n=1 Tax=Gossypium barbadense TaxID=3634 RepID=A0A2P5YUT5_GOSBA|nr:hypothetical protein GOBAR_AA01216 [Gossypium barbadense]
MLTKFISVSETHFQNTETILKNQQASIQGLETQIGQLAKLISERPQGSLPSNTESSPREQLNAISIQDEEGLVAKPRPESVVIEGKNEEISSKDTHEPCSIHNKESTHEERRLRIEELDEWLTFKPRKHDKPKLRQKSSMPHQINLRHFRTTRPGTRTYRRPCTYHKMQHCRAIRPCENKEKISSPTREAIIRKSSKAHPRIGTKNSTRKGSPRLPCPARPRP